MYEVCRVQKLDEQELAQFDDHFIDHLFEMVETTRDQQDERLNYAVIKLIVSSCPHSLVGQSRHLGCAQRTIHGLRPTLKVQSDDISLSPTDTHVRPFQRPRCSSSQTYAPTTSQQGKVRINSRYTRSLSSRGRKEDE